MVTEQKNEALLESKPGKPATSGGDLWDTVRASLCRYTGHAVIYANRGWEDTTSTDYTDKPPVTINFSFLPH